MSLFVVKKLFLRNKAINPMLSKDEFNVNKWLRKSCYLISKNKKAGE
jgi:hypothetical protein